MSNINNFPSCCIKLLNSLVTSAMLQKPWSAQLPLRFAGTRMAMSWNSFDRRGDRSFSRFWDGGCSMERTISRIFKGHWDHNQWNRPSHQYGFCPLILDNWTTSHCFWPWVQPAQSSMTQAPATNKNAHEMDCAGPQIWKDGKISRWRSMWEHLQDHFDRIWCSTCS